MKKYRVKSVERHANHLVLTLVPKSNAQHLRFWPGQYATIGFKRDGKRSPMRCFSMINSPASNELQFAMRPDGQFTSQIAKLVPGTDFRVQGPFGNFVIDSQYDKNIIMLAAGIGITPFISMLRRAAETNSQVPMMLVYACRSTGDIPFYDEIRELQKRNQNIKAVFVVSQDRSDASKAIYSGRVDEALLQKITNQRFQGYTYFICGPKKFMEHQQATLEKNSVDENRIVTESFTEIKKLSWGLSGLSIPSVTYTATAITFVVGFLGIMAMDLLRYTPKTAATTIPSNPATSTASSSATPTSAPTDSTTQSTANAPSSTQPAPTYTYQNYYQPPVSSVS